MRQGELVELFLDRSGHATLDYPHVHVIHHGNGTVEILASLTKGVHTGRKVMHNASGQQVEAAIVTARNLLNTAVYPILKNGQKVGFVKFVPYEGGWLCFQIAYEGRMLASFRYKPRGADAATTLETGAEFDRLPPGGTYHAEY